MPKTQEKARLLETRRVAEDTHRIALYAPRITATARPGQFVMVRITSEGTDPLLNRPFSFHRIHKDDGLFEILFRVVGRGTWLLSQRKEGETLEVIGPLGNFFTLPPAHEETVALVAGGIGIAPMEEWGHRLAQWARGDEARRVYLFYGARTASEVVPTRRLERKGVTTFISTDDGTLGRCGTALDLLDQTCRDLSIRPQRLYSCGPLAMQAAVATWARQQNLPAVMSLESVMACGIGACLGCALPAVPPDDSSRIHYVHVCKEGPVFDSRKILWEKMEPMPVRPLSFVCS
ncbi:dihydroorotate oxidase B, electron transfer subunit [Desulfacinum hydrothermale DSM 13146]|uniref:Dihydroorotate oxidase B, electron transfer subunit n=1 Tax=Desulfacinum hydrothermale DSM 13146 TaxID=1121390 RepID=A0A1W1XAE3_9BACT|nr:dihydroorotate dehydrogenase electron transfer subunit [Desulfacinum hydrothermale]SMC20853.1 dihydroorotate oxidase B, electron transfer subunit [Desulfacinum hydrothermale DSM 13146]